MRFSIQVNQTPRVHVVVENGDEFGRLNNLEAEVQGVRDALEVAMARGVELHVLRQILDFFSGPWLIRQHAALHDTGLRFGAQKETARVRKNRISRASGPGIPGAFNIRLAVRVRAGV